jgi:hypothetical protein
VETIALALLCSGKDLIFLDKFMKNEYLTQKSVQDLFRHIDRLGLKRNLIEELNNAAKFYHKYSHISLLTIASWTSFSKIGQYVGSSFDQGKIES